MTQADLGQLPKPIYPGEDTFNAWNNFDAAYKTGQLGAARPAWAEKGFIWAKDNGDGSVTWMGFNGDNVPLATEAYVQQNVRILSREERWSSATYQRAGGAGRAAASDTLIINRPTTTCRLRLTTQTQYDIDSGTSDDAYGHLGVAYYDGSAWQVANLRPIGPRQVGTSGVEYYGLHVETVDLGDFHKDNAGRWQVGMHGQGSSVGSTLYTRNTVFHIEVYEHASGA